MKKKLYLSSISEILLFMGLGIIIVYLIYILVSVISLERTSSDVLIHTFSPQLEYIIMSMTLIIVGALLLDVTAKELKKE